VPEAPPRRPRGEERDELIRADLVPLGPGERPPIVKVCAAVCLLAAAANILLWAAGWEVSGQDVPAAGAIAPALVLGALAYGLWQVKYLAVAGMQVFLGLTALGASASLLVASNWTSALQSVAVIAACMVLFWPLIRINARVGLRERIARGQATQPR
jgi:hypothetical protein